MSTSTIQLAPQDLARIDQAVGTLGRTSQLLSIAEVRALARAVDHAISLVQANLDSVTAAIAGGPGTSEDDRVKELSDNLDLVKGAAHGALIGARLARFAPELAPELIAGGALIGYLHADNKESQRAVQRAALTDRQALDAFEARVNAAVGPSLERIMARRRAGRIP